MAVWGHRFVADLLPGPGQRGTGGHPVTAAEFGVGEGHQGEHVRGRQSGEFGERNCPVQHRSRAGSVAPEIQRSTLDESQHRDHRPGRIAPTALRPVDQRQRLPQKGLEIAVPTQLEQAQAEVSTDLQGDPR